MSMVETNLSELLNKPKATLAQLRGARRIVLRRRDDEDLVLTTAARAEQDSAVLGATSRMFVEMMRRDPGARTLVLDVMPAAFPWVRFLPTRDVREFAVELVDTLSAATESDNTAAVAQLITEWKHTAEVHADPELYAALTTDSSEDFGPVPEPGTAA